MACCCLVAPAEHKVRIEVGYGLEGTLTDALSSVIISSAIVPRFKANDFSGGIRRGVDGIIAVLTTEADEWHRKANVRADDPSGDSTSCFQYCSSYFLVFFIWYLIHQANGPGSGPGGTGGRRRPVIVPPLGGSWGSGWGGGGFSGGGGFRRILRGGGGSAGGGGASGAGDAVQQGRSRGGVGRDFRRRKSAPTGRSSACLPTLRRTTPTSPFCRPARLRL